MSKDDNFHGVTLTNCKANNCDTGFLFGKGAKVRGSKLEAANCVDGYVTKGDENSIKQPLAEVEIKKPITSNKRRILVSIGSVLLFITTYIFAPAISDLVSDFLKEYRATTSQAQPQAQDQSIQQTTSESNAQK